MDNNYKKILNQIINYEDALLTQKLSTATFTDILKRVLFLRKQYNIDFTEKYFETLETLIQRNKNKEKINTATLEKFGKLWVKNTCKN